MKLRSFFGPSMIALAICTDAPQAHGATCGIVQVSGVAFGTYDIFAASPNDANGSISIRCTGTILTTIVNVLIDRGGAPTFSPRQMRSGTSVLNYQLYNDPLHLIVWGDNTGGTLGLNLGLPLEGAVMSFPVYGRIPAKQNVVPGSYSDTVLVTVVF